MRKSAFETRRTAVRTLCALLALLALSASPKPVSGEAGRAELFVIVPAASKLTDMSLNDLRRVFTAEIMEDPDGRRIIPLNQPPGTQNRVGFDRAVLRMSPEEVGRYWIDKKIRGGSGAPRTIDSQALLARIVAKLPGAMAYVERAHLGPGVRAIKIDGKAPGAEDYPVAYSH